LKEALEIALKLLDSPHDGSVFRFVLGSANKRVGIDGGGGFGAGDFDDDVVGIEVLIEDGFYFHADLETSQCYFVVDWHYFEGEVYVLGYAVGH
jgi:hypothetical protein